MTKKRYFFSTIASSVICVCGLGYLFSSSAFAIGLPKGDVTPVIHKPCKEFFNKRGDQTKKFSGQVSCPVSFRVKDSGRRVNMIVYLVNPLLRSGRGYEVREEVLTVRSDGYARTVVKLSGSRDEKVYRIRGFILNPKNGS